MTAVEDEIDFSRYLVDIDDDGGADLATNITNAAFASSSYLNTPSLLNNASATSSSGGFSPSSASASNPAPSIQSSLLQTHSAKNWPTGLIQPHQHIGAISPSPPESASDSSYKASTTSTAGTAPSSVASTSYPGSSSSWGTQKTFINDAARKSNTSGAASSLSSSATSSSRPSALSSSRKSSSNSADHTPPASSSTASASHKGQSQPSVNLSFNYDFAHNPALGEAFSPSAANQQQESTSYSFQDTFDPAQYSASLPSSSSSRQNSFSLRHGSSDRLSSMNDQNSDLSRKPLSPSSGPQHVAKGHRSRQASSASNSMSSSLGGSGAASPHWLSMTPATPSMAIPQFASTPYSRPVAPAMSASDSAFQQSSSYSGSGSLSRRPSKRKTTTNMSNANIPALTTDSNNRQKAPGPQPSQQPQQPIQQFPLNTTSNYLSGAAAGLQQFGFPLPAPSYRDTGSAITSPISPSLENFPAFANFMSQNTPAASSSTVPSPVNQQSSIFSANTSKSNSNASTPNDAILSAITAPSPFDPKNFGSLDFDPLSDDFNAHLASLGVASVAQSPTSTAQSPAAQDVTKAAALAGVAGKWINWTNAQKEDRETNAALISTVLTKAPEIVNAPTPSASASAARAPVTGTSSKSGGNASKASTAFETFPAPAREGSVLSNTFGDIDGDSPEDLAAKDPLATHLWRLYAKAKAGLPNGARMENITWRMMSLKLNKQKADAASAANAGTSMNVPATSQGQSTDIPEEQERGRRGRSAGPSSASPRDE